MLLEAKNGTVELAQGRMEYIRFGTGDRILVMLPGLGDGLKTVKGMAVPMALMYRMFAGDFTVYVFSRKELLQEGYSTRDMARDQAEAMDNLGIEKADILGVSMGGMIAQYLAVDFPDKVNKLVLAVTGANPNPVLRESVDEWITLAEGKDHTGFMDSNLKRLYSESYYRKNRWLVPVIGWLTKPKSYDRFIIQAKACLNHDAFECLQQIRAETFVVGGELDLALGAEASRVLAERIPRAKLLMYPQWGHGLYEEEKDFNKEVLDFLYE